MTRLLCAYCGVPLSVFEFIARENVTRGLRVAWHPWCHRKDEGLQLMAWPALLHLRRAATLLHHIGNTI